MSSPHPTPGRAERLRQTLREDGWTRARAIASIGMVFGLGAVGTLAAWSDTATATTGDFSTTSVDVRLKLDGKNPTYAFTSLGKLNLARGGSTAAMLPVQNVGTADFNYTVKATTADEGTATYGDASASAFAQNLLVSVYDGGSANGTSCTSSTAVVTDKALSIGDTAIISAGQRVNAGDTQNLCFRVALKSDAPKEARMAAVSVKFQFTATQATP